mmetsp:Transcript_7046/g.8741  ORF Transcript_7046/g.8741 Transcript_7046/m.8741 type:complete len:118 (+) Transcript_7046:74-427(+)
MILLQLRMILAEAATMSLRIAILKETHSPQGFQNVKVWSPVTEEMIGVKTHANVANPAPGPAACSQMLRHLEGETKMRPLDSLDCLGSLDYLGLSGEESVIWSGRTLLQLPRGKLLG